MKKTIFSCAVLIATSLTGYSQFFDKGYKNLQLGMTETDAKAIIDFTLDAESGNAIVAYDNISLELTFVELEEGTPILYAISSTSPNSLLYGVNQSMIGMKLEQIQKILGIRIQPFESDGLSSEYFLFYKDQLAVENDETSCVLQFDESEKLIRIIAAYNP